MKKDTQTKGEPKMTEQEDTQFLQEVKTLSQPQNTTQKTRENREAIRYLAAEIAELKKQVQQISAGEKDADKLTVSVDEDQEEEEEEEETGSEELEKIKSLTERQASVLHNLHKAREQEGEVYQTQQQLAEKMGLNIHALRKALPELKDLDLVSVERGKGLRLVEHVPENALEKTGEIAEEKKEEKEFECLLCGEAYNSGRGLGSHLFRAHDITAEDVGEDVQISDKFNAKNKTREEINEIRDELGDVDTSQMQDQGIDVEEDFPRFDKGEKIEDPQHWTVGERKKLTAQILEAADKPLTRQEIAKRMYNLDEQPKFGEPHYNAISNFIKQMDDEGTISAVERLGVSGKAYALSGSELDVGQLEGEPDRKKIDENVEVQDGTRLLDRKVDDVEGRREFNSYKNTLAKLIHKEGEEKIDYYKFSRNWGGEQKTMDGFRVLFESPSILNSLRREVCPDMSFKWSKESGGNSPSTWVLEVEKE